MGAGILHCQDCNRRSTLSLTLLRPLWMRYFNATRGVLTLSSSRQTSPSVEEPSQHSEDPGTAAQWKAQITQEPSTFSVTEGIAEATLFT